jgi:hypothetical protein
MTDQLNFDLTNPTPFIQKYIQKHSSIINKMADSLFTEKTYEPDHPFQAQPEIIKKLAWELAYFRLLSDDSEYYLS